MCGIFGIIAPNKDAEWRYETIRALAIESISRGRDATGVAFVDEGIIKVIKDGVDAGSFVRSEEFKSLEDAFPPIVIGHVRAASKIHGADSANDNLNNHPFYNPATNIAIVHNGLVDDAMWREIEGEPGGPEWEFTGGTDSEAILRVLETVKHRDQSTNDMLAHIDDTCFNISGKYAVAVLSGDEPDKLWLIKHDNPVCLAFFPDDNTIVFASDEKILKEVLVDVKTYLGFFVVSSLDSDIVFNDLNKDYAVEIAIGNKNKPKIRGVSIEAPDSDYDYHVKAAEMIEEGKTLPEEITI